MSALRFLNLLVTQGKSIGITKFAKFFLMIFTFLVTSTFSPGIPEISFAQVSTQKVSPVKPAEQPKQFQTQPKPQFQVSPSIKVVYPNGGETWEKGKTYTIRWTSQNVSGNVKIMLKWGTGSGGWYTITESTASSGIYIYNVPKTEIGQEGPEFKIFVMTSDGNVKDESDGFFRIESKKEITVIYPNGGEIWEQEREYTFRWRTSGKIDDVCILLENERGVKVHLLWSEKQQTKIPNTGSFRWLARFFRPGKYRVHITPYGLSPTGQVPSEGADTSDGKFEIIPPGVELACGIGEFGPVTKTTYYVFAAEKTKYVKFDIFIRNNGTKILNMVPIIWFVLKQPGNIVLLQEEAGFGNVYPNKIYETTLKFNYEKLKAYPFYGEHQKKWEKGEYSFMIEVDPKNILGEAESARTNNKCEVKFKIE